jgi:hypothetical protein
MSQHLASERIVVSAPFSLHGSAARIWKVTERPGINAYARYGLIIPLAVVLIVVAWVGVLCWYLFFGILVVPYRLIRRGSRKRKVASLRHRELLDAATGAGSPGPAAQGGDAREAGTSDTVEGTRTIGSNRWFSVSVTDRDQSA